MGVHGCAAPQPPVSCVVLAGHALLTCCGRVCCNCPPATPPPSLLRRACATWGGTTRTWCPRCTAGTPPSRLRWHPTCGRSSTTWTTTWQRCYPRQNWSGSRRGARHPLRCCRWAGTCMPEGWAACLSHPTKGLATACTRGWFMTSQCRQLALARSCQVLSSLLDRAQGLSDIERQQLEASPLGGRFRACQVHVSTIPAACAAVRAVRSCCSRSNKWLTGRRVRTAAPFATLFHLRRR